MAQTISIDTRLNDNQARQQLSELDRQLERLRLKSTGVKISLDNNGQVSREIDKMVDRFGRIVTVTSRWKDILDDAGNVVDRVVERSAVYDNNLQKRAQQEEKLNLQVQGLLNAERQIAEAQQQAAEATRQRIQAQQEAVRLAQQEAEIMSAFGSSAFHPYSSATSTKLSSSDTKYLYDMLGAKQTSIYTLDYINKSLGITRDHDSSQITAREAAAVFELAEAEKQASDAAQRYRQEQEELPCMDFLLYNNQVQCERWNDCNRNRNY